MTTEAIDLINAQVRRAIAGETITDPTASEWALYMAAAAELLNHPDQRTKDSALQAIGLVAMSAMNHRLRAAAVCAKATHRARLL